MKKLSLAVFVAWLALCYVVGCASNPKPPVAPPMPKPPIDPFAVLFWDAHAWRRDH